MNIGHTSYMQLKHMRVSTSACTECPMLYDKILSIKPVNHLSPSCKDCPDFSPPFALSIYKGPLKKKCASLSSDQSSLISLVGLSLTFNKLYRHFHVLPEFFCCGLKCLGVFSPESSEITLL
jgi:hypothetical protein